MKEKPQHYFWMLAVLWSGLVFPAVAGLEDGPSGPTLKEVSRDTVLAVATSFDGENGIIHGPEVERTREAILRHFHAIQAAVYPAWGGFWPQRKPDSVENFSFWIEPLSAQVEWAKRHGLQVIHHGLLAPNYYFPEWWREAEYAPAELETLLQKYIKTVVSVPGVDVWNVVNELYSGDGRYFREGSQEWDNRWLGMGMEADASGLSGDGQINKEHPLFIRVALECAAEQTDGRLEIREGATFRHPRKLKALYQLVLHLKNLGARPDAVGIQGHLDFDGNYDFEGWKVQVEQFRQAGVEVYITELDVGLPEGMDPATADWTVIEPLQAAMFERVIRAAREAEVPLISLWGLRDAEAGGWRGGERALLMDRDFRPKPAYDAVMRALRDEPME